MPSRLIQAHFPGRCRVCGKSVAKGEAVYFMKHFGVRCQACGPHTASDEPIPSKRSTKVRRRSLSVSGPRVEDVVKSLNEPTVTSTGSSAFEPQYAPAAQKGVAWKGQDGVYRLGWESVSELVEDAFSNYAQSEDARVYLRDLHRSHSKPGDTWANGHNEQSLRESVGNPKQDLLDAIEQMRGELVGDLNLPTTPRRKVRRGQDDGDELDADRWLARDPNAWDRSVREAMPRRTVTIGVNVTVYCSQEASELLYRGAAACALADLLTEQGLNVRIVGFSVGERCSSIVNKIVSRVELKAADMPLDLGGIASSLCDVGFFRMVTMPAEWRHLPGEVDRALGRRGSQYLPGADRKALDFFVESNVTNRTAAVAWLREQLKNSPVQSEEVCHV